MKRLIITLEADVPEDTPHNLINDMVGAAYVQVEDAEQVATAMVAVEWRLEEKP